MHKIKTGILILLMATLGVLCLLKIAELKEWEDRRRRLVTSGNQIDLLAEQLKKQSFSCLKSKELFFEKIHDLGKSVGKISQGDTKILVRRDSKENTGEVKVFARRESEIYEFIEKLLLELPGVIQFQSIQLFPSSSEGFSALIRFKFLTPDGRFHLIRINPTVRSGDVKFINFFGAKETKIHNLFCTICDYKACIDNFWFQVGDRIDDGQLVKIDQNFIELKDDSGKTIRIKLGASW